MSMSKTETKTISLTIEVPAVELTEDTLREAVIDKITAMTLGIEAVREYDDEEEWVSVQTPLLRKMKSQAEEQIRVKVGAIVEREIPPIIQTVLSGEYQPVDQWGDAKGKPTTIRSMIAQSVQDWLKAMVDGRGNVMTGYQRDKGTPRLRYYIKNEVDEAYKGAIQEEAKTAAAEVKTLMAGKVKAEINAVVNRIMGTK